MDDQDQQLQQQCEQEQREQVANQMGCGCHLKGTQWFLCLKHGGLGAVELKKDESNKHDSHYSQLDIEPVDVSEQIAKFNTNIPRVALGHIQKSTEYNMRSGLKDGEPWRKEIEKSINHLTRALTGEWKK